MTKVELIRQAFEAICDSPLSPWDLKELVQGARNEDEKEIYAAVYNCVLAQSQREMIEQGVY